MGNDRLLSIDPGVSGNCSRLRMFLESVTYRMIPVYGSQGVFRSRSPFFGSLGWGSSVRVSLLVSSERFGPGDPYGMFLIQVDARGYS